MAYTIVVAVDCFGHGAVRRVAVGGGIMHLVAVSVSAEIGIHISGVVAVIDHRGTAIVVGEMIPVVGRSPYSISCAVPGSVDDGRTNKDGLDYIIGSIDERVADDLYIGRTGLAVHHKGCYILKDIDSQYGLQYDDVVVAAHRLNDADIIHVAITVEVEVGKHIGAAVEESLKLHDASGLSKGGSDSAKVQALVIVLYGLRGNDGRGGCLLFGNRNDGRR